MATNNSEIVKAYCAGLFDGEGCVIIWRTTSKNKCNKNGNPKLGIRCLITNSSKDVLRFVQSQFGGAIQLKDYWSKKGYKQSHNWYTSSANAMRFLHAIYPYLIIKKKKVEVAFEFEAILYPLHSGKRLSKEELDRRELLRLKLKNTI